MRGLEREERRSIEFEELVEHNSKVELSINISKIDSSTSPYHLYPWQRLKLGVGLLTAPHFHKFVLFSPNSQIDYYRQIHGYHL